MVKKLERIALSFDDILLVPQYSECLSRKNVDISSALNLVPLRLPVISSPMSTVTEADMVIAMNNAGGLGVIHKYNSIEQQVEIVKSSVFKNDGELPKCAAAIGVGDDCIDRAEALVEQGLHILCVDIAHGHHLLMKKALNKLKNRFGDSVHIMAGNVATGTGFQALSDWGADSVRLFVGAGSICSTRMQTGHGLPSIETLLQCKEVKDLQGVNTGIIADGGIKHSGDIVKALAFGADAVMCGSLLAGTDESPGEVFSGKNDKKYKVYAGMASRSEQMKWRNFSSAPEGITTTIPYKGSVVDILYDIRGHIQSGFSYSGVNSVKELQDEAMWIRQSPASQKESFTHILNV